MAGGNGTDRSGLGQALVVDDPDVLRGIGERAVQAILDEEMTAHLGAARYERGEGRVGYRNGFKPRTLTTRVGTLEVRVPQDRDGTFSTEVFARHQRREQALVTTLMEMDVQGVSTRKVAAMTEELWGTSIAKSQVSALVGRLDPELAAWRTRPLPAAADPYLVVDARYEHARVDGRVVRIFPHRAAVERLVTALALEQSEEWVSGRRYLDMDPFWEDRRRPIAPAPVAAAAA